MLLLHLLDDDSEVVLEAHTDDDHRLERGEEGDGEEEEEVSLVEVANADIEPMDQSVLNIDQSEMSIENIDQSELTICSDGPSSGHSDHTDHNAQTGELKLKG